MESTLVSDLGNTLRRWEPGDAADVVAAFDDPLMSTQTDRPIASDEAARNWIGGHLDRWDSGTAFSLAVLQDGVVAGSVTIGSIDRRHRLGWVSYWTTASSRSLGIASSALRCASDWAFGELQLFRLELGHRTNNPASCGVALAAGFAVEGLERQKLEYDGLRYDVELHARLATDPAPVLD